MANAAAPTVGVEEEFFLVDAATGRLAPCADRVLARVPDGPEFARRSGRPLPEFKFELLTTQLETASSICGSLAEVAEDLLLARRMLADAAAEEGSRLVATATPWLRSRPSPLAPGDRYRRIAETYARTAGDYECNGCHVHVAVGERERAVAVLNHLRPWLPTLLALSSNSPFRCGTDTGYGSWRAIEQTRFPAAGMPPYAASAEAYDAWIDRLVACGARIDERHSMWLARVSNRFPTVELRASDSALTVEDAVLQAALARGLVVTALRDLERGREAVPFDPQVGNTAVWSAARHGVRGWAVDVYAQRQIPARRLLDALVRHTSDALEDAGDLAAVQRMLGAVVSEGTGAERQRAAAGGGGTVDPVQGHRRLTDFLVHRTLSPPVRVTGGGSAAPHAGPVRRTGGS
ncbi:carboxylate-amine ligase [Streptomyces sulphureus]|uniref:carboxylate-amine ligase n=1 Tax=Streptomyces sulphureus TaxID=47758 RepID=UPI00036D73E8|nr:glutamate--cysteine ligase [Streptomyces sulphureus]